MPDPVDTTNPSMVERVAIALYGDIGPDEWVEVDRDAKELCRFNARRAIKAMRDATDDMIDAGHEKAIAPVYVAGDECPSSEDCWHAMIDAALSEKPHD